MTDGAVYALETRGLSREFGGFFALNGAGKTTLFNLLTKYLPPSAGTILHDGHDVTRLSMPAMAKRSVVRSFQISAVFAGLTVRENIELALLREHGLAWNLLGRISRHRTVLDRADA